jgi:prepilin-type N-terminal cleavage/methylation domain-containing protein
MKEEYMSVRRLIIVVVNNMKKGFSLIEMILYIAIVSIFLGGVVQLAWNSIYGRVKSQVMQQVSYASRFAGKRMLFEIRNASGINSVTASSLCLASADSVRNPTHIYLSGSAIHIGWGGGSPTCASTTNDVALTGSNVTVSSLVFTNLSTSSLSSRHVQFTYTISSSATSGRQEYVASQSYEGSAEIRSH